MTLMKILIALLVFGVIITIHELGHFVSAKLCHIKVNEFAIGMGPALFKKRKGETLYSLRLLPVGGYCAMEGEDQDSESHRSFGNRPIWQQIIVLAAGAIMNLLMGLVLIVIIVSIQPGEVLTNTVAQVTPESSAAIKGLQPGDSIRKINGMHIYVDSDIVYQLTNNDDGILDMEVERNGERVLLEDITFQINEDEGGRRKIAVNFSLETDPGTFIRNMDYSFRKFASTSRLIWISAADLIKGKYALNQLSGPVGIVDTIGTVINNQVSFKENLLMILNIAAFIAINVGMFNLLPIPALDGCRILFRVGEGIFRKKISPSKEGMIHAIGLGTLMLLMVFVTFNDVVKLFNK